MILVFTLLIFVTVALVVGGVMLDRRGPGARALAERLRTIGQKGGGGSVPRPRSAERDTRFSTVPWLDRVMRSIDVGRRLELLLYQAGMTMRAGTLVLLTAALAMAGYVAGLTLSHRLVPALAVMALVAPAPYLYVRFRKAKRMKAFAKEFPEALDLLVSGLRAGLSFPAALRIVADESPDPVSSEFTVLVEEQSLGLDFREAMSNLADRVDVLDLRFFVTAVILQRETGGNLAEVLSKTAELIRERFRVLGDVETFTAQGRLSGVILVCLPVGIGIFTALSAPEYFRPMIETAGGRTALMWAAGLQALGVLAILKIVNIKV